MHAIKVVPDMSSDRSHCCLCRLGRAGGPVLSGCEAGRGVRSAAGLSRGNAARRTTLPWHRLRSCTQVPERPTKSFFALTELSANSMRLCHASQVYEENIDILSILRSELQTCMGRYLEDTHILSNFCFGLVSKKYESFLAAMEGQGRWRDFGSTTSKADNPYICEVFSIEKFSPV